MVISSASPTLAYKTPTQAIGIRMVDFKRKVLLWEKAHEHKREILAISNCEAIAAKNERPKYVFTLYFLSLAKSLIDF